MFFIKYETEENINGELPPIIYIKGNRNKCFIDIIEKITDEGIYD